MMNAAIIRKKPSRIRSVDQIYCCGSPADARGREPNSIRMGDDCASSEPRWSGRQSLSTILLTGMMRLSLFCNARRKSEPSRDRTEALQDEGWGQFASRGPCGSNAVVSARGGAGAGLSLDFFRAMQCEARQGKQCLRQTEQQTSAAAEGACAESPLGGTVATQAFCLFRCRREF